MRVSVCDQCKAVIEEEVSMEYSLKPEGCQGIVTVNLSELDWCMDCARRERAKIFRAGWDDNKQMRKKVAGGEK